MEAKELIAQIRAEAEKHSSDLANSTEGNFSQADMEAINFEADMAIFEAGRQAQKAELKGEPPLLTNREIREAKAKEHNKFGNTSSYKRFAATRYDAAIAQAQLSKCKRYYEANR